MLMGVVEAVWATPSLYTSYQNQRFAMEPQDQTAVVGARVTLPCRVINKQGTLQWTKDDFGLGTSRDLSGFERYAMVGSNEEGDYSLDIYPVMLDDDARYQCQVSPGPDAQPAIRSTFAGLTVLVPPEAPKITQGDVIYATEDRKVEIECVSIGGKPAAEITWIDGLGNVLTDNIEYTVIPLPDLRRYTAKSLLRLTPKKEHHNTNFTCQAQNTADRTYRSAKIRVEVKYAPKVKVNVIGPGSGSAIGSPSTSTSVSGSVAVQRIVEHAQVRLECRADANPSDVRYRWYINDEPIIGGQKTEMVIRNVTRKFHDAIVKCEVQNSVGKSEDSETLDISYAPSFKQRPQSMEADVGSIVSLNCEVDSNPQPEIVWIQHPSDRVVGTSTNLTFSVSNETAGRYYCKANVPGYAEISADAYVYLKGSPSISSLRSQCGLVGDTARIECFASSVPRARHVSWTFNGQEISSESGHDYSILVDAVPGGVKSILIIRDSQANHYGKYNCTVVNDYGNDVAEIQLLPKKSVSLYMTEVYGLSMLAFVVVFIVILILIYLKFRKRTKLPPADVISEHQNTKIGGVSCKMEPGDRTSNYSDLKLDISGGYVPYGDYSTHYSPPPQYLTSCSTKSNGSSTILQNNHQNQLQLQQQQQHQQQHNHHSHSHHQQQQQQQQQQQTAGQSVPMTFLTNSSGGSLTGSIIGAREIRQENGLPSLQSTTASVVSSSPNGSCSNQSTATTTHVVVPSSMALSVDPRYSAIYGNPYLRTSNSSLLPPPTAV
ncbi:GH12264 [Drosophila grimshawi]|uniref:GH12264 n=2 Tax=Drosophila grimshawi TaxID=7222 RepID=B4JJG1_DROGR|nr:GH12264 [Drosophila grimshawi]